jgi:hypothetical protein
MDTRTNAGRLLVGLATVSLLAGCAARAPTPVSTPTSVPQAGTSTCVVATLAGTPGVTGTADGVGAQARFSGEPQFIAMDAAGALFITDTANHTIRKMTPDGTVTTFAGKPGEAGDVDGVGAEARFARPGGLAFDASGGLYVADADNHSIRMVTPDGTVTTLAKQLGFRPAGIALDAAGNVYTAGWEGNVLLKIAPDGTVTELAGARGSSGWTDGVGSAARFKVPVDVKIDGQGVLWVVDVAADYYHSTLRKVTTDGTVTTLDGDWATYGQPGALWVDRSGVLYATSYPDNTVTRIGQDGTVTLLAGLRGEPGYDYRDGPGNVARFRGPVGIIGDASGLLYVVDSDNGVIRTMRCTP